MSEQHNKVDLVSQLVNPVLGDGLERRYFKALAIRGHHRIHERINPHEPYNPNFDWTTLNQCIGTRKGRTALIENIGV